jgi:hypothetical protein
VSWARRGQPAAAVLVLGRVGTAVAVGLEVGRSVVLAGVPAAGRSCQADPAGGRSLGAVVGRRSLERACSLAAVPAERREVLVVLVVCQVHRVACSRRAAVVDLRGRSPAGVREERLVVGRSRRREAGVDLPAADLAGVHPAAAARCWHPLVEAHPEGRSYLPRERAAACSPAVGVGTPAAGAGRGVVLVAVRMTSLLVLLVRLMRRGACRAR